MKTAAIRRLREQLAAGKSIYGVWSTFESANVTEIAVALGLDYVVIDAEHGHLDWHDILEHVRATVRSHTVALVRISDLNIGTVKRVLDIGADGIVVPWVETVEQLQQAVAFARYPLEGVRGFGGERATGWGTCTKQTAEESNEHVLVVPLIESVRGVENIEQLCQVDGVELFYQGPADLSSSAGHKGHWEGPGVAEQVVAVKDAVRAAGKHCGIIGTGPENLLQRHEQGFRMLGLGMDGSLLVNAIQSRLKLFGHDRVITTSLDPTEQA